MKNNKTVVILLVFSLLIVYLNIGVADVVQITNSVGNSVYNISQTFVNASTAIEDARSMSFESLMIPRALREYDKFVTYNTVSYYDDGIWEGNLPYFLNSYGDYSRGQNAGYSTPTAINPEDLKNMLFADKIVNVTFSKSPIKSANATTETVSCVLAVYSFDYGAENFISLATSFLVGNSAYVLFILDPMALSSWTFPNSSGAQAGSVVLNSFNTVLVRNYDKFYEKSNLPLVGQNPFINSLLNNINAFFIHDIVVSENSVALWQNYTQ